MKNEVVLNGFAVLTDFISGGSSQAFPVPSEFGVPANRTTLRPGRLTLTLTLGADPRVRVMSVGIKSVMVRVV